MPMVVSVVMPVMAMPVIVVQGVDTAVKVISFFCRMTMKFQHDRAVTFLVPICDRPELSGMASSAGAWMW